MYKFLVVTRKGILGCLLKILPHVCQTPTNIDSYPTMDPKALEKIELEYKVDVKIWAAKNGL